MKYSYHLLALILFLGSCNSPQKSKVDLLILNATVLDVVTGEKSTDRLIAISGDRILSNEDMEALDTFSATDSINARDHFVIPGLWDMHVHFRGGDSLVVDNQDLLPLFLAYGVTTVRDAGGDISPEVLDWREKIANKELIGPTIFTSGPKLDGEDPAWPGSIEVAELSDISRALDSLQNLNVDFVKMYDGSMSKEVFYGIIAETEKRGMKTTGHMPLSANILKGVSLGLDGSEHLYYVLKACSPQADSLTEADPTYGMMDEIIKTYDPTLASQVFKQLSLDSVFVTPTLHIGETLSRLLEVDHNKDSLLTYISGGIQKTYRGRIEGAKRAKKAGNSLRSEMVKRSMEMIKPMYDAGVPLLAGSDCGAFNSFVYPGASLHAELARLVAAGLSPREAITTSIINGPAFFDLEDSYGSITPGKTADLLLLSENPFNSIQNLKKIETVISGGEVYGKIQLQAMLDQIQNNE